MSTLAELPEIVGFFSYSREDDEAYKGRLSALREVIQQELGAQLGRSKATFRLWQDKAAIAPGKLWETEINNAVTQSAFFIPIVTPRMINSRYCQFEFDAFQARERAMARTDLIFPILYVPVAALQDEAQWRDHPVLSVIGKRQYVDWQLFRYSDVQSPAQLEAVAQFCATIVSALREPILSAEERRRQQANSKPRQRPSGSYQAAERPSGSYRALDKKPDGPPAGVNRALPASASNAAKAAPKRSAGGFGAALTNMVKAPLERDRADEDHGPAVANDRAHRGRCGLDCEPRRRVRVFDAITGARPERCRADREQAAAVQSVRRGPAAAQQQRRSVAGAVAVGPVRPAG